MINAPSQVTILAAVKFIEYFENPISGPPLQAYWDSIGKVWTIGTGLTRINGQPVVKGQRITSAQNDDAVNQEMRSSVATIREVVTTPLNNGQWVALLDFVFNCGAGCLMMAGMRPSNVLQALNDRDFQKAADGLLIWDHAGGVQIAGLTHRRADERIMMLTGMFPEVAAPASVHSSVKAPIHMAL